MSKNIVRKIFFQCKRNTQVKKRMIEEELKPSKHIKDFLIYILNLFCSDTRPDSLFHSKMTCSQDLASQYLAPNEPLQACQCKFGHYQETSEWKGVTHTYSQMLLYDMFFVT